MMEIVAGGSRSTSIGSVSSYRGGQRIIDGLTLGVKSQTAQTPTAQLMSTVMRVASLAEQTFT
jgi:hypothetical protein